MAVPQTAAEAVLDSYYDSRGEVSPRIEAARLLCRTRIRDGTLVGLDNPDLAEDILRRSSVDVDDLAEFHLGIDLRIENLERLDSIAGAPVYGVAEPGKRRICICERATRYQPLYRTTVMHEVGHVELHRKPRAVAMCYAPFARNRPPEEQEADLFMRSLLLPDDILLLAIGWVASRHNLNPMEALAGANSPRGRFQWWKYYFPEIISRLCVSGHLTSIKLKQMNVIHQETVAYHLLRPARPNRWMNPANHLPLRRVVSEIEMQLLGTTRNIAS